MGKKRVVTGKKNYQVKGRDVVEEREREGGGRRDKSVCGLSFF